MTDTTRKIQLSTSVDSTGARTGLQEVVQAAEGMAAGVKRAGATAAAGLDGVGNNSGVAAKKIDAAEKSIISSIQRRTAVMQAGNQSASKYYEALAGQRGVSLDVLKPYLAQLDAAQAKQNSATVSLGNMGMSAKATAAALRGVPAQFTDIAVSLAGGQAPLTVLLQQGGQLKDMFGGLGNAARALGGYVAGLVNPVTLTAGALAAIGTAAFQGSRELQAFNKTLILNGGTSGVYADQLMGMAAGIDAMSSSITQSRAAEVLNEIVAAGVRGEVQIRRYAKAAAEFEVAGGGAATEVAKAFSELGKDPLQASLKLNQAMGYLTESTYAQIKSLEDQGRTLEAATVAQNAYASALENRTPALLDNLGLIERGWNAVKNGAKEAWDAMLNIGRADTLVDQIAAVEKRLAAQRNSVTLGTGNGYDLTDPRKAADEALLASLREQQTLARRATDLTAERAQREKERIGFLSQADKYLSSEQRQQKEILAIQDLVTRQIISQGEAEKRIAAIREQSAKKSATSARSGRTATQRDEFGDLYNRITLKDAGLDASFYKDLNTLYAGYQKGRIGIDEYRTAVEQLTNAQRFAQEINKANAISLETEAKFVQIVAEKERAWALETQKRNQSAEQMITQIEFETSLLGLNTEERERALAMRELERLGIEEGTAAYEKYAAALQKAMIDRQQKQEAISFWNDVNSTAESVFIDVAMNGEDAFKRIGESIKREVIQLLYEMTVKKWIFQIAGVSTGGVGGSGFSLNDLSSAYSAFSTGLGGGAGAGAGAVGGSASAVGSYVGGSMSYANATGSIYANATGAGIDGLLATNSAYGTAGAGSSASGAAVGYMGYAALIAAAVMIAENLYEKGYTRAALGYGKPTGVTVGQYSSFESDPEIAKSSWNNSWEAYHTKSKRDLLEAIGFNDKWADIFSSTTRLATIWGRKLKGYGLQAEISGDDVAVSGYQYYKGGLFRSNKTVSQEIDPRDAAALTAEIEGVRESARAMAQALGYTAEGVDNYTGSLKVNFKGVKNGTEAAERMQEAMDDLQLSMLKAASGGKITKEEFEKFMEGIQASIQAAGITADGIGGILSNGIVNGLSGAEIGQQLTTMIMGGIYTTMAQNAFAPVVSALMGQIITPMFTAIASGIPLAQALNKAALSNIVQMANEAAALLNELFNNAEFRAAMDGFGAALGGIGGAASSVRVPSFGLSATNTTAADTAREREQLELELLRLQGDTVELRRRELLALKPSNRALQERIWALEDETALQEAWSGLADSIIDEIKRIKGEILGDTPEGLAVLQAQFATATAQARAGDQEAAGNLPALSQALLDAAEAQAASLSDWRYIQGSTVASLQLTNDLITGSYGLDKSSSETSVADKVVATKVDALGVSMEKMANSIGKLETVMTKVTNNGNAMRQVAA